ncbi:MAG: flippase-like domain-containing protein [Candidatus Omnitrophica bacterium]|nr:flippase-like domain-containing protein [Candidatus Omnitrophota bacterium]
MSKSRRFTPKQVLRYAVQGAVLAVLAAGGVVLFYTDPGTFQHLRKIHTPMKCWMGAMVVFAWLCNGMRVFLLSRSLGYKLRYIQCLSVSLSSEFGIAATPAGMGGAAIRLTLLKRAGVPLAHSTAMLAMDVALDTVFFLLLIPFAVYSIAQNAKIRALFAAVEPLHWGLTLSAAAAGLIFLAWTVRSKWLHDRVNQIALHPFFSTYRLPARLRLVRGKAWSGWRQMSEGFTRLLQLKWGSVLLTFCCASMQWICRYSILPLLLYALSLPCDPVLLFLLQGFLFTGSLVLVMPGGGGGVEVASAVILRQIIPPNLVGVVVLLWRFFTYHLYLLGGGSMFLWTCTRLRQFFPSAEAPEEEITFEEPDQS